MRQGAVADGTDRVFCVLKGLSAKKPAVEWRLCKEVHPVKVLVVDLLAAVVFSVPVANHRLPTDGVLLVKTITQVELLKRPQIHESAYVQCTMCASHLW